LRKNIDLNSGPIAPMQAPPQRVQGTRIIEAQRGTENSLAAQVLVGRFLGNPPMDR